MGLKSIDGPEFSCLRVLCSRQRTFPFQIIIKNGRGEDEEKQGQMPKKVMVPKNFNRFVCSEDQKMRSKSLHSITKLSEINDTLQKTF